MSTAAATQGLGAKRWNLISDEILQWGLDMSDMLLRALVADGYPPGTQPASDYQQYEQLQELAEQVGGAAALPLEAQEKLYQLSLQFGPPQSPLGQAGEITGQPFNPQMALNLRALSHATFAAQHDAGTPAAGG